MNKLNRSETLAISTVFIGLIGLIVVFSGLKIVGNVVIWFACVMLFVVCYVDASRKSKERKTKK